MTKTRLEAFSDGVIAIIITIMVLELHAPHEPTFAAIRPLAHGFVSYVLSFVMLGIYWNNHHHLFLATRHVDGKVLWANLHLLFWLSLIPFVTAWMGGTHFAELPAAAYGAVLLAAALAYTVLVRALIARHGRDSTIAVAIKRDVKGWISVAMYVIAIPSAFLEPWLSYGLYAAVAIIWIIPDPRIERALADHGGKVVHEHHAKEARR